MKLIKTRIPGVVILEPQVFNDDRGWFFESFHEEKFHELLTQNGLDVPPSFVQDNHSCSRKGVLRGLHYQTDPNAQGKLVRVARGSAYDVAVDIRKDSPTYRQWVGVELNDKNHCAVWIPAGFAHGFLALEDNTHLLYKNTVFYHKESERNIRWNDPTLAIDWPLDGEIILHEKDEFAPFCE